MNEEVVIYIHNGTVSDWKIPPGITVLIKDYDCPKDWDDLKVDKEGDTYQEIILKGDE